MKKVSILLKLTTVLAAFSFAQVTVVGGFEADNVTGGDDGKMDPALWTEFYGAASEELGPGTIGAELGLGAKLHFGEKAEAANTDAGDVYLKGSYALPAGPGELALGISTWPLFNNLNFGIDYSGIAAGPVSLGLGVAYDFNTTGRNDDNEVAVFGDGPEAGKKADKFTAKLTADFDFGLGITYKFRYFLNDAADKSDIDRIVYLDINYKVIDPLVVGLEIDDTGKDFKGTANTGFTLKPYVDYSITEKTTAGLFVKVAGINNDVEGDTLITPGLTIKHVF
jgi:hypothetical protein